MKFAVYGITWLLAVLVSAVATAEQLAFKQQNSGGYTRFDYSWHDAFGQTQRLVFSIPATEMQQGEKEFSGYDNDESARYVYTEMQKRARLLSTNAVKLSVSLEGDRLKFSALSTDRDASQRALNQLESYRDKLQEEYIRNHYFSHVNDNVVMPDHPRIAARYAPAMRPVAQAIARELGTKDPRTVTNYVLGFLQSIPYDTLQNRYTSNGAGFQTPYGLIAYNRGDCDTKSVAFSAIMRNFFPNARMMMVYVPGHALIGFDFATRKDEAALRIDGDIFILAEPVGPGLMPLGEVGPQALAYLRNGQYSYQEIPR